MGLLHVVVALILGAPICKPSFPWVLRIWSWSILNLALGALGAPRVVVPTHRITPPPLFSADVDRV